VASKTTSFGVSKRESHDSSGFYSRQMFLASPSKDESSPEIPPKVDADREWVDRIFCQSSESMPIPDQSVALAFTSPPYNVGKDYDADLGLDEYLSLIQRIGQEVYRVLMPGGRYVINIANLGRKPYIPLHMHFYQVHFALGFLPMGEIIWRKAKGANGSCAWGSWKSARSPRLRDIHEYLLVFARDFYSRPDKGNSDISPEEFMESTLSVWDIPPESAKKIGHPAPFPIDLAARVIKLYTYTGDVVLDPFVGSGATCLAASQLNRHYVGFDINPGYCRLANHRLGLGEEG
jgi:DNA modification methylase